MADQLQVLQQTVDRLTRQVADLRTGGDSSSVVGTLGSTVADFQPVAAEAPKPAADQQLKNGDLSHSTGSFWEAVVAVNDEFRECFAWFSHDAPVAGQSLDVTTDARSSSVNKTLKNSAHSTYDPAYCDWDSTNGVARLTGTKSLDALLSGSPVFPGRPEYFACRIARRNATIIIQDANRIAAMLYNNTLASEDFMQSGNAFHLSGVVRDGIPPTVTQRKYKVLALTDRGYSFLSDELDLPDAPSDAAFGTYDVYLTWPKIDGVLSYQVYRHDIVAAKFRLLKTITSGSNTYGDNNRIDDDDVGAYPAATNDRVICYVATRTGELSNVAIDGVSAEWNDLFLNIPVPAPLLSAASGKQVFRLAMTQPMDRQMTDVISTAASPIVQSASAQFSALDTGRSATLRDADGNILHGPDSLTFIDATHASFSTNVATNNTGATLYIVEGGDHGLLIDLLHLSYIEKAKYSSWPEDRNRTLSPTATPNTSGQGGIGTGGDSGDPGDGGIGGCIPLDCPAWIYKGDRARSVPFSALRRGIAMVSGNVRPNFTRDLLPAETDNLHIVEFENGIWLPCSHGQRFFTSQMDRRGTAAHHLQVGDFALTMIDGRVEQSRIIEVRATGQFAKVGTPVLTPGHSYVAGYRRLRFFQRLWRRLWPQDQGASGAIISNAKIVE